MDLPAPLWPMMASVSPAFTRNETSRTAQICLTFDQARSELKQANARLLYARAAADRRSTRAELVPVAAQLGLAPTRREQVWKLPSEFLADDRTTPRDETPVPLLALAYPNVVATRFSNLSEQADQLAVRAQPHANFLAKHPGATTDFAPIKLERFADARAVRRQ